MARSRPEEPETFDDDSEKCQRIYAAPRDHRILGFKKANWTAIIDISKVGGVYPPYRGVYPPIGGVYPPYFTYIYDCCPICLLEPEDPMITRCRVNPLTLFGIVIKGFGLFGP